MGKILLISQEETDTWFVNGISIGVRQARNIVGTKIKELLSKEKTDEEIFINSFEPNFRDNIKRILNNEEFPKDKIFNKILKYFNNEVDREYFFDRNLKNVLVNDSRMVVAEYETEARALEVKKQIDELIIDLYKNGKPIIIKLPKE